MKPFLLCFAVVLVQAAPHWRLKEDLRIGSDTDSSSVLQPFKDMAVAQDGSMYIAQATEGTILRFDRNGTNRRAIGRPGRGPGEIGTLMNMGWNGDSIVVTDLDNARFAIILGDRIVRTERYQFPVKDRPTTAPTRLSGTRVLWSVMERMPDRRTTADTGALVIQSTGFRGARIDTLQAIRTASENLAVAYGGGVRHTTHPFAESDLVATSPARDRIFVVTRKGNRDGVFRITAYSAQGREIWRTNHRVKPRRLGKSDLRAAVDHYMERMATTPVGLGPDPNGLRAAVAKALGSPPFAPIWKKAVVGNDGRLWLQAYYTDNEAVATWFAFDATGTMVGSCDLPRQASIVASMGKTIWTYSYDHDDIPAMVRYVAL